jgi:hypothetical protein
MSLIPHLLRWDVRRFRVLLAVWVVLVAANTVLEGVWPALAADLATRHTVGLIGNLVWLARLLLIFVLAALVVQAHPLVGSDAFWTTRPIRPGMLLASKLILLAAMMIAIPVAADVALMIAYHVPPNEIAAVAAQNALSWTLWVVLIISAAALTPSLAQFALVIGAAIVAAAVSLAALLSITMYRFTSGPPSSGSNDLPDSTGWLVGTVLIIAAAVSLLVVQYRTRNRVRSIAIGVAGLAIAYVISSAWPWPVLAAKQEIPPWAADGSMLRLSADADTVSIGNDPFGFPQEASDWRMARARVGISGIEPGWSADIGVHEAAVRVDGKVVLTSRVPANPIGVPTDDAEGVQSADLVQRSVALRRLLNVERVAGEGVPYDKAQWPIIFFAKEPDIRRVAPTVGAYEGRFRVSLTHHTIEAILPLRRGAVHENGAFHFALDRVELQSGRVSINARELDARSAFDRRPPGRFLVYLRNQRRSEVVEGSPYDLRNEVSLMRAVPFSAGFGTVDNPGFPPLAVMIMFHDSRNVSGQQVLLDSQWLEQAELVIVRSTQVGSVERQLAIPNLPIRLNQ